MHHFVSHPPVTGFSHQSCWFNASSDVKILCFITHPTSFSHFTLGHRHHLLPNDHVIICLGHLLSSLRTTCPYHFNILFSILSKIVFHYPIFTLITSFLTFSSLEVLAVLLQKSISVLRIFLTCNPGSIFPNHTLKCFLSLHKILVSLYLLKHIYSTVGYLVLFFAFLACSILFNSSSSHLPEYVRMGTKYLNGLLLLLSMLFSSLIFCKSFQHLNTLFKEYLHISSISDILLLIFVSYSASPLSCAIITRSSAKR